MTDHMTLTWQVFSRWISEHSSSAPASGLVAAAHTDAERRDVLRRVYQPTTTAMTQFLASLGTNPEQNAAIMREIQSSVPAALQPRPAAVGGVLPVAAIESEEAILRNAVISAVNRAVPGKATPENVAGLVTSLTALRAQVGPVAAGNMLEMVRTDITATGAVARTTALQESPANTGAALDSFIGNMRQPARVQIAVSRAIREAVTAKLNDTSLTGPALETALKDAIIKAVTDNIEQPADAAQRAEATAALERSATALARRLSELRESQGPQAAAEFGRRLDQATPMLPVSNATLITGAATGAAMLVAGDNIGDWTSIKGIAIKLGIIGAAMGVAAFVTGDLTTSMFTGPRRAPDTTERAPT